eukprot:scaffold781_cov222-Chaetoceros_neogracile.AAC.3
MKQNCIINFRDVVPKFLSSAFAAMTRQSAAGTLGLDCSTRCRLCTGGFVQDCSSPASKI